MGCSAESVEKKKVSAQVAQMIAAQNTVTKIALYYMFENANTKLNFSDFQRH